MEIRVKSLLTDYSILKKGCILICVQRCLKLENIDRNACRKRDESFKFLLFQLNFFALLTL